MTAVRTDNNTQGANLAENYFANDKYTSACTRSLFLR